MITFNNDSFTVQVHTGCAPADNYKMTIDDIISLLQAANAELRGGNSYYHLLELLRAMMPDEAQVKKLIA